MPAVSLACYSVVVQGLGSTDRLPLGAYDNQHSLEEIIGDFLSSIKEEVYHNTSRKRLLRVEKVFREDGTMSGHLRTGEYGYTSELYDVATETKAHDRATSEAELIPFFFMFYLPSDADRGIAILQRFGNLGIRSILAGGFGEYFSTRFPKYRVHFNPLVPRDVIRHYLKDGRIRKIEFIRFSKPGNIEDLYDLEGYEEQVGTVKTVITARRNRHLPEPKWLKQLLNGKEYTEIVELQNSQYDRVRLEIGLGSTVRTIDLADLHKLRGYIDVTEDVKIDDEGHPQLDSLDRIARGILSDLKEQVGILK